MYSKKTIRQIILFTETVLPKIERKHLFINFFSFESK